MRDAEKYIAVEYGSIKVLALFVGVGPTPKHRLDSAEQQAKAAGLFHAELLTVSGYLIRKYRGE